DLRERARGDGVGHADPGPRRPRVDDRVHRRGDLPHPHEERGLVVARDEGVSGARGNPFGHIDLRVASVADALPFYEALLPPLGFTARYDGRGWHVFANTEPLPAGAYFGITESADHLPGETRIAFWASDRSEVERV